MTPPIAINDSLCIKDGLCARVCPKVFAWQGPGTVPDIAREQFCNDCGHCLLVCPAGAISHPRLTQDMITPVEQSILPSYDQVREMVRTRRSTRLFHDRPVEREILHKIIDGARFAPTAKNTQSTEYVIIRDRGALKHIATMTAEWLGATAKKLRNPVIRKIYLLRGLTTEKELALLLHQFEYSATSMKEGKDFILHEAPALILFHAAKKVRFAEANANLALQNATFTANALGLGSFYTGYVVSACVRDNAIPELLGLPSGNLVYAGLALGYPKMTFSRWIERDPPKIRWI